MKVDAALERHLDQLMAIPGVEGAGIGGSDDAPVIIVMVRQGGAEMRRAVPSQIEGFPVEIDVTGEITAS